VLMRKTRDIWIALVVVLVAACANNPVRVAQTTEQKAYALYGTFVIVEEQAVKLTLPTSNLNQQAKASIINAVQRAQPAIDTMLSGLEKAQKAKADFDAQRIDKPAFQVVVDNLGNWVQQAEPLVLSLTTAVKGVQQP